MVLLDVVSGVMQLESFDMAGLMDFVHSLGAAYYRIGEALQDCDPFMKEAGSDEAFKKMVHLDLILKNPDHIAAVSGKNLYVNGNNILPDLLSAERELKDGEWGNAGYFLGEAAKRTLGGEDTFHQLEKAYGFGNLLGAEENNMVFSGNEDKSTEFTF